MSQWKYPDFRKMLWRSGVLMRVRNIFMTLFVTRSALDRGLNHNARVHDILRIQRGFKGLEQG